MSKNFAQYDSKWASLGYPKSPDTMYDSGCGVCACADIVVNNPKYTAITPKEVREFMIKNGYAIAGAGTAWNGITACMKHYGFNVTNHSGMSTVWTALSKGNWGIFLFRGGSVDGKTVFTTCGHYMAVVDYKVKNGKHYVYLYDSGLRKHTGWFCYETQIKGLLPQVWTFSLPTKVGETTPAPKISTTESKDYMTATRWKTIQTWLGVKATGRLAGQSEKYAKNLEGLSDIMKLMDGSGKSDTVKALQCWLGFKQSGVMGTNLIKKLQGKIGVKQDGIWGDETSKVFIEYTKKHAKPSIKKKQDTRAMRFIDALEAYGRDIEKKYKYSNSHSATTWAGSKKNHIVNCARYVSWCLQYAGILNKGKVVYCTNALKGSGASQLKSSKHTKFSTPKKSAKTLAKEGKLKRGDICMFKNGKHTMVVYSVDKKTGDIHWYSAGGSDVKARKVRNRDKDNWDTRKVDYLIRIVD